MCDRRTSSRCRKLVDYSVTGENNLKDDDNDNDDEDFAVSRGPPAKKLRTAKEKTMETTKSNNLKQTSSSKSNNRTSNERLFERDLDLAMKVSKTSSPDELKGSQIKQVSVSLRFSNAPDSVDAKFSQSTDSAAEKETKSVLPESSSAEEKQHETEGEMASVKKDDSQLNNDDAVLSDHLSSSDAESSEDDEAGSDSVSSFDSCQGRRTKKQALNRKNVKAKPSAKPAKSAKPTVEKLKNSKVVAPVNPASSSQKMISRSNLPKARDGHAKVTSSDKQPSYSSPTSGVLRIGLSRNVKVKPLHQLHSPT